MKVLNIVYAGGKCSGGFYPDGMNLDWGARRFISIAIGPGVAAANSNERVPPVGGWYDRRTKNRFELGEAACLAGFECSALWSRQ